MKILQEKGTIKTLNDTIKKRHKIVHEAKIYNKLTYRDIEKVWKDFYSIGANIFFEIIFPLINTNNAKKI